MSNKEKEELRVLGCMNSSHRTVQQFRRLCVLRRMKETAKSHEHNKAKFGDKFINPLKLKPMSERYDISKDMSREV